MATIQQIAEVRVNTQELQNTEPYTDDFLSELIDAHGVSGAELRVWTAKRNTVAALVDISEGGSSRKQSQIFEQYDKIVKAYESGETGEGSARRAPRTRAAVRG